MSYDAPARAGSAIVHYHSSHLKVKNTVPLDEMQRKLSDRSRPIAQIAAELGVTRQAVYERMRRAGIAIGRRKRASAFEAKFPRELLRGLYEGERLTVDGIATRLGTDPTRIRRELAANTIRIRSAAESQTEHDLSTMVVWDTFDLSADAGGGRRIFSNLYRRAKRLGIRITIRRTGPTALTVTRLPVLSPENAAELRADGMPVRAIAGKLRCSPRTVSQLLREKK